MTLVNVSSPLANPSDLKDSQSSSILGAITTPPPPPPPSPPMTNTSTNTNTNTNINTDTLTTESQQPHPLTSLPSINSSQRLLPPPNPTTNFPISSHFDSDPRVSLNSVTQEYTFLNESDGVSYIFENGAWFPMVRPSMSISVLVFEFS